MSDSIPLDVPLKQCTICLEWRPKTAEFFESSNYGDGFRHQCRICRRAGRRVPKPVIPEGMKPCSSCKRLLSANLTVFNSDLSVSSGLSAQCKECRNSQWKAEHPPKRQYAIKDGMKRCTACKEWKPLTPEYYHRARTSFGFNVKCRQCRAKARNKGPRPRKTAEELKQANLRYVERHREEVRARVRINMRNRRLQKKVSGKYTAKQIQEQYQRQKHKCYWCGDKVKWGEHHIDHIVPLSRGGTNDISNLVISCPPCNLKKHTKLPHEWPEGGRLL